MHPSNGFIKDCSQLSWNNIELFNLKSERG